jgi:hypothetical protein
MTGAQTSDVARRARAIRHAHSLLMAAYDDVLSDASLLTHRVVPSAAPLRGRRFRRIVTGFFRWLTGTPKPGPRRALRLFRALVRFLCELHIRQRLLHLRKIYRQVGESASSSDDRGWFVDAQESAERTAQSLAGWAPLRRGMAPFFSFGAGVAVVALGAENAVEAVGTAAKWLAGLNSAVLLVALAVSFIGLQRALLWVTDAFEAKRDLFFPQWRAEDDPKPGSWPTWDRTLPVSRNVYELENRLYRELRREKPQEAPVDAILIVAGLLLVGAAAIIAAVADTGVHWTVEILLCMGAAGFFVLAARVMKRAGKRASR